MKLQDTNTIIDFPVQNAPEVFPYPELLCCTQDFQKIQLVSSIFTLEAVSQKKAFTYSLKFSTPKSGEHKLHTVTLLAAALLLNQTDTKCKSALYIKNDFPEILSRDFIDPQPDLAQISEGTLLVKPACQLYLSQVGFNIKPQSEDLFLKAEDFRSLSDSLFLQTQTSNVVGL